MSQRKSSRDNVMATSHLAMADVYAQALLENARDEEQAGEINEELSAIVDLMDEIEGVEELLTRAILSTSDYRELIERIFRGRVSEPTEAMLAVLARRNRLPLLRAIAAEFPKMLGEKQGKIDVTVTTTTELDDEQREKLIDDLRKTFDAEPMLTTRVDRELLGGLVVQAGELIYDASVATALKHFSRNLMEKVS